MIDDRDDKVNPSRELEADSAEGEDTEFDDADDFESDELEAEESEEPAQGHRRGRPKNAEELVMQELPARASGAHDLLRSKLRGKIQLKVKGAGNYHLDWSGNEFIVKKNNSSQADTTIEIEERDLMKITTGGLNPQIGMLSDKIQVSGNPEIAVYFFNLIAR
jgi:putative sterol carrier protein